jgi:hypothetical protein
LFCDGLQIINHSEKEWDGVSVDLIIDQEFMRSLETSGGPTSGGGMTEFQQNLWVMSCSPYIKVNYLMQELTGKKDCEI